MTETDWLAATDPRKMLSWLGTASERRLLLLGCRSAAPHVRGCWAVDLLLGKS